MFAEKSDQEVIAAYLAGDESAFAELVQRHITSVYSFAYGLAHSPIDAEDITQETFVKVWKNIKKYKKEYTFKTWVLTIARNTAYDFFRKRKYVAFSAFEDTEGNNAFSANLTDDKPLPIEISSLAEDKEILENAVAKLSPLYREIITLRYGEELTFEEISVVVKRPMNTVKSQARRALIELRKILE